MQMHADFTGVAGYGIPREVEKNFRHRHFIVREVDRLEPEKLAKQLEARQECRIASGNFARFFPQIVPLRIDGDDEGRISHVVTRSMGPRGGWMLRAGPSETFRDKR